MNRPTIGLFLRTPRICITLDNEGKSCCTYYLLECGKNIIFHTYSSTSKLAELNMKNTVLYFKTTRLEFFHVPSRVLLKTDLDARIYRSWILLKTDLDARIYRSWILLKTDLDARIYRSWILLKRTWMHGYTVPGFY